MIQTLTFLSVSLYFRLDMLCRSTNTFITQNIDTAYPWSYFSVSMWFQLGSLISTQLLQIMKLLTRDLFCPVLRWRHVQTTIQVMILMNQDLSSLPWNVFRQEDLQTVQIMKLLTLDLLSPSCHVFRGYNQTDVNITYTWPIISIMSCFQRVQSDKCGHYLPLTYFLHLGVLSVGVTYGDNGSQFLHDLFICHFLFLWFFCFVVGCPITTLLFLLYRLCVLKPREGVVCWKKARRLCIPRWEDSVY